MREMKDSGIHSIGYIPITWKLNKLKSILKSRNEKNSGNRELLSVYLNKGVISYADSNGLQVHKPSQDLSNYQNVYTGDFVLNNQQAWRGSVGVSTYEGIISPAYFVYEISSNCHSGFMNYSLRCSSMFQQYENASRGVGTIQRNLYAPWLLECIVPLPEYSEQKSIADFLDSKCSEIDGLISDIQKQITTLEEYKRSVITEAVTKGLNPDAEMKDSGVEWIGVIPKHWKIEKIKYHLKRNEPRNPGNKQVLSVYREYGVIPKDSRDDNHNVTSDDTSKYKYVVKNNLVINKMKAWQGSMGVSDYEGIVSPAYFIYIFTSLKLLPKYIHYLFRSSYKDEFRRISGGIREGQWDLSADEFENTVLLIPTISEQHKIIDYIQSKTNKIDSIISEKKKQIETIEEYKKSLIFEYVTGKKEVYVNE